jgi:Cd2+/Zn2+-exporting ATPase
MSTARFRVQGMDCASCATKIETAVRRIEGVESVKVGLHTETLAVVFGEISRREAVKDAVNSLGYKATLLDPQDGTERAKPVGSPQSPVEPGEHSDHGEPIEGAW